MNAFVLLRTRLVRRLRALELLTRPVAPELSAALRRRWEQLPAHVRNEAQSIGRRTVGCEGTHGVFPRCNLACTPCYHSRAANRVRVDGAHTVAEVDRQMELMARERGPGQNAQLIGGEVSLLDPDDHAAALAAIHRHGRKPMSMSHGDFDYDYLERLALGPDGHPRLDSLSFAGHFDSMMFGRRGLRRVGREPELNEARKRFCDMFARLHREHGVSSYLAHNMTVTPRNVDQVAQVIRDCRHYGFRMFSFQPAAFVGNDARWRDDYAELSGDVVWEQMEAGAGTRLPYRVFQIGDERCNRTAYGVLVGERWVALLDDGVPADLRARDTFYRVIGAMDFAVPRAVLAARLARAFAREPSALLTAGAWARRFVRRAGGLAHMRREGVQALTLVMHSFMNAADVRPAWEGLQRGQMSEDPRVRATQERLQACSYAMAHPEDGTLVPACVQHSVLDPQENLRLQVLLPLPAGAAATSA